MTKSVNTDIDFIQSLAKLIKESELGEIRVTRQYTETDILKVRLSKHGKMISPIQGVPMATAIEHPAVTASQPSAPQAAPEIPSKNAETSPMVGTVYLSPEPGSAPFVKIGDSVSVGQTLLIIEAMKTMNQIPATRSGTVKAILVDDAIPVEYGDPLVLIE